MTILDRLRAPWRSSDPQARRAAAARLDDAAILHELARSDPEAAVRDVAAARLTAVRVATATSDGAVADCEAALAQLAGDAALAAVATRAAHAAVRTAALGRIASQRVLRDVVRGAGDPAIRTAALARIDDASLLRSLTASDVPAEVALAAVERIDDPDVLAAVARRRDAPKVVRRRARALAPDGAADAAPIRAGDARARQHELCVQLQAVADAWDCEGLDEVVREAASEWDRLAAQVPPREDVAARFARAREAAASAVAGWERRRAEAVHVEATHATRLALIERVEADEGADANGFGSVRAAWDALDPLPAAEDDGLSERFRAACAAWEARRAAWLARRGRLDELAAIADAAMRLADAAHAPSAREWKAVAGRWRASFPSDEANEDVAALRERFEAAAERVRERRSESAESREREQRANVARLEALLTRLDAAASAEPFSLRAAGRELRTAERALADLGPLPPGEARAAWRERLGAAHDRLRRRFRDEEEAEGWRRFANAGVQEELIGRVQALLDSGDLAAASAQLGEIQREWERAATAPRDRSAELWERYRTARNALRRRCDAYQAENLKRKQALCERAEALADSTDWKATADEVKRLQAEWKAIGPVPARHTQALWRRFRAPCDRFFARRKEHFGRVDADRAENARRKVALCEKAEALADSKEWEQTAAALKRLQAQWKEIGPVPRADTEALWQRFRGACDRFFDRRSRRDELEHEEQVAAAGAACAELESAVQALATETPPAPEDVGRLLDAAWAACHALDDEPGADTRALGERLRAACEHVASRCPDALRGTRIDPAATRGRREKLCARLEALVEVALAPARVLSLEEQALRLKERLAAKTIGGAGDPDEQRRQDAAAEIRRLRAQWTRLGPPLGEDARAAAERFARACARLDGGTPASPS